MLVPIAIAALLLLSFPVLAQTGGGASSFGSGLTINSPVFSGTATGSYTLGGVPTLSGGTLSGTTTLPSSGQIIGNRIGVGGAAINDGAGFGALTVSGATGGALEWVSNSSQIGQMYSTTGALTISTYAAAAVPILLQTHGANTRMTIADDGTITAALGFQLSAPGDDTGLTDATLCRKTTSPFQVVTGTGASGICLGTSSKRFKKNIRPDRSDFMNVMALKPKAYEPTDGPLRTHHFFIAEDVQRIFPDLVGTDAEGRANNIDHVGLLTKLVALVQHQQHEIGALKRLVSRR